MIATTPEPPYVAVIFSSLRSQGRSKGDDGYAAMSSRMAELVAKQPGFLGVESARGADGFGLTVSYWKDEASARAWKQIGEHLGAQALGKQRWYESYTVRVAMVTRAYGKERA